MTVYAPVEAIAQPYENEGLLDARAEGLGRDLVHRLDVGDRITDTASSVPRVNYSAERLATALGSQTFQDTFNLFDPVTAYHLASLTDANVLMNAYGLLGYEINQADLEIRLTEDTKKIASNFVHARGIYGFLKEDSVRALDAFETSAYGMAIELREMLIYDLLGDAEGQNPLYQTFLNNMAESMAQYFAGDNASSSGSGLPPGYKPVALFLSLALVLSACGTVPPESKPTVEATVTGEVVPIPTLSTPTQAPTAVASATSQPTMVPACGIISGTYSTSTDGASGGAKQDLRSTQFDYQDLLDKSTELHLSLELDSVTCEDGSIPIIVYNPITGVDIEGLLKYNGETWDTIISLNQNGKVEVHIGETVETMLDDVLLEIDLPDLYVHQNEIPDMEYISSSVSEDGLLSVMYRSEEGRRLLGDDNFFVYAWQETDTGEKVGFYYPLSTVEDRADIDKIELAFDLDNVDPEKEVNLALFYASDEEDGWSDGVDDIQLGGYLKLLPGTGGSGDGDGDGDGSGNGDDNVIVIPW